MYIVFLILLRPMKKYRICTILFWLFILAFDGHVVVCYTYSLFLFYVIYCYGAYISYLFFQIIQSAIRIFCQCFAVVFCSLSGKIILLGVCSDFYLFLFYFIFGGGVLLWLSVATCFFIACLI